MKKGVDYPGITIAYFCHDGEGNYVMNKRGANCRDEQNRWDFGAGGLDLGETVEGTLRKEIKEEFCTDVLDFEFLGYKDLFREHDGQKTHWTMLAFKVLVDRSKVANGEPHKFDDFGWFRLDNLPQPLHSAIPELLEEYRGRL